MLCALAAATWPAAARAAEAPGLVVERSDGASDCPDANALAREVGQLVGRADAVRAGRTGADFFEIHIAKNDREYRARIDVRGARVGARELADAGPSCAGLHEALALTLAILVDDRPAEPSPLPPTPEPASEVPAWGLGIAAGGAVTVGLSGGPWPAVVGGVELRIRPAWAIAAGGLYAPPRVIDHPPGDVTVSLGAALLRGCATLPAAFDAAAAPWLCLVGALGALSGEGSGFTADLSETRPWLAGGASLGVDGRIAGPLRWQVGGTWVAQTREQFGVDGDGDGALDRHELAFDPPVVAGFLEIGVGALW
jgi:hypothetical protein